MMQVSVSDPEDNPGLHIGQSALRALGMVQVDNADFWTRVDVDGSIKIIERDVKPAGEPMVAVVVAHGEVLVLTGDPDAPAGVAVDLHTGEVTADPLTGAERARSVADESSRGQSSDAGEGGVREDDVPTFVRVGGSGGTWCVRHRHDDPLPEGARVEVLRADGRTSLVTIQGQLDQEGSDPAMSVYLFSRTYMGDQILEEGPFSYGVTIRRLHGAWEGVPRMCPVSVEETPDA